MCHLEYQDQAQHWTLCAVTLKAHSVLTPSAFIELLSVKRDVWLIQTPSPGASVLESSIFTGLSLQFRPDKQRNPVLATISSWNWLVLFFQALCTEEWSFSTVRWFHWCVHEQYCDCKGSKMNHDTDVNKYLRKQDFWWSHTHTHTHGVCV